MTIIAVVDCRASIFRSNLQIEFSGHYGVPNEAAGQINQMMEQGRQS